MAQITFTSLERLIHLLNSASLHKDAYVRVLGPSQLGLGSDPLRPSHTVDLAKEALVQHFDDEMPMDLDSSAANGSSASQSVPNRNQPQSTDGSQKATNPPAQNSNTKLMERLDATTNAKRA